ncbi:hypothetical protein B0H14DRAFT_848444 [Mycena olivaceomarginata]|nr:hypothetical protein B0H14DRAFT_848444 [Mycena olivaceomarginata]
MFLSGGCGVAMIWMVFRAGSNAYDGFSSMIGFANLLNSLALHGGILRGFAREQFGLSLLWRPGAEVRECVSAPLAQLC